MYFYEVAPNKVFRAGESVLTYSSEQNFSIGTIVEVEVGKNKAVGVVISGVKEPKFKTKPILRSISDFPLPPHLLEAADFLSNYYATETAVVWQTILPSGLEKTK